VITDAGVAGVVLDGKRAKAVRFVQGTAMRRVEARREVILSAGAIGSPQLLELSGIGQPDVLKAAGVEVRHALKGVGENLQDHYQVRFIYEVTTPESLNAVWNSPLRQLSTGLEYMATRRGILTIGAGVAGAFLKTRPELEEPDIQFHFMPLSAERPGQGLHEFWGVTASVCVLRPTSRGHQHIVSADPRQHPKIVANYLATEFDRQTTLDGMRVARRIANQPAFRRVTLREHFPGSHIQLDDEMLDVAKKAGATVFHPCGTARMGPATDTTAVVDTRLRVHGLEGLRVVDASIMPNMISGNTNAPTIMIAEKAADMIRAGG
jgi:choline dehydrogenase